jgi:hypothetical protein
MNEFEDILKRTPLRQIPSEWRGKILEAALGTRAEAQFSAENLNSPPSLFAILKSQISSLLWPSPKAWAGLAAVWLVIIGINIGMGTSRQPVKEASSSQTKVTRMAILERQQEVSRLLDSFFPSVIQPLPGPRTDRRREIALA